MKGWRGLRGSRGTRPKSSRPLQHMRVYARGHRPNVVYMRCSKIRARSNAHNSLQFRPFSTKKRLTESAFRDATRDDAPEAVAPQIRPISVFFTKRLQFRPFSTKLGVVKKARRDGSVCKASAKSEHMHICICIYAYAYMHMHICICILCICILCICILCIMLNFM